MEVSMQSVLGSLGKKDQKNQEKSLNWRQYLRWDWRKEQNFTRVGIGSYQGPGVFQVHWGPAAHVCHEESHQSLLGIITIVSLFLISVPTPFGSKQDVSSP